MMDVWTVQWDTPDGRDHLIDFDDEGAAQRFAYAVEHRGTARNVFVSGPQEPKPDPVREAAVKERLAALWRLEQQKKVEA